MRGFVLVAMLLVGLRAEASSCFGPVLVCSSFQRSEVAFRGRVVGVVAETLPPAKMTYPDGSTAMVSSAMGAETVRFSVLETFKGAPGIEIEVRSGAGEFHEGQEYLVFASTVAQRGLATSFCSGSRPVNTETAGDLAWLRAYPTAPPLGSIAGQFFTGASDLPETVSLSGPENRNARTTGQDRYRFDGLPPGEYTVTASLPAGFVTQGKAAQTVSLVAKGCAEVDWVASPDTHVRGAVRDGAGRGEAGVPVGLLHPEANRNGFAVVASARTDESGRYEFARVTPGEYWVALYPLGPNNREAHAPVFYPAGTSSAEAKLLRLTDTLEGIDLVAGEALRTVTLRVRVVNADGSAAVQAHLTARDSRTPTQAMTGSADADGNGEITLYAGRTYSLVANTAGYREPACAGPVRFVAGAGVRLETMRLDKSWAECRRLQGEDGR